MGGTGAQDSAAEDVATAEKQAAAEKDAAARVAEKKAEAAREHWRSIKSMDFSAAAAGGCM